MSKEFKRDIVDGRIIDWSKLSLDELKKLKEEYMQKKEKILKKIENGLNVEE